MYENNLLSPFSAALADFVASADAQVQAVCDEHFGSFTASLDELLRLRSLVDDFRSSVSIVHSDLDRLGENALGDGNALIAARKTRLAMEMARAELRSLRKALVLMQAAKDYLHPPAPSSSSQSDPSESNKRRSRAGSGRSRAGSGRGRGGRGGGLEGEGEEEGGAVEGKTKSTKAKVTGAFHTLLMVLKQLEEIHIPRARAFPRIHTVLSTQLPKLKEEAKAAAMGAFTDWLETQLAAPEDLGRVEDFGARASVDIHDLVPVFKCLYIFSHLGDPESFQQAYRDMRSKQRAVVLVPPAGAVRHPLVLLGYLLRVARFFLTEHCVMVSTQGAGLISRGELDTKWEDALSTLLAVLERSVRGASSRTSIVAIVEYIRAFTSTVSESGTYRTSAFGSLNSSCLVYYLNASMAELRTTLQAQLDADTWDSLVLTSSPDLEGAHPTTDAGLCVMASHVPGCVLESLGPGSTLPFTRSLPVVYALVDKFVDDAHAFVVSTGVDEPDEKIRSAVDNVLVNVVNDEFQARVAGSSSIFQLISLAVNMEYLTSCVSDLEGKLQALSRSGSAPAPLAGALAFQATRSQAEDAIYASVESKVDMILSLADYVWLGGSKKKAAKARVSDYIPDLLSYLDATFASMDRLGADFVTVVQTRVFKRVAGDLVSGLTGPEVTYYDVTLLQQIRTDIAALIQYLGDSPLVDTMAPLQTVLDVLLMDDESAIPLCAGGLPDPPLVLTLISRLKFKSKSSSRASAVQALAKALKKRVKRR